MNAYCHTCKKWVEYREGREFYFCPYCLDKIENIGWPYLPEISFIPQKRKT